MPQANAAVATTFCHIYTLDVHLLDWAAAHAAGYFNEGYVEVNWCGGRDRGGRDTYFQCRDEAWHPAENWAQAGPLIEEGIRLTPWVYRGNDISAWKAEAVLGGPSMIPCIDRNPRVAALRCYVAWKLGRGEIEVPDDIIELCENW